MKIFLKKCFPPKKNHGYAHACSCLPMLAMLAHACPCLPMLAHNLYLNGLKNFRFDYNLYKISRFSLKFRINFRNSSNVRGQFEGTNPPHSILRELLRLAMFFCLTCLFKFCLKVSCKQLTQNKSKAKSKHSQIHLNQITLYKFISL